MVKKGSGMSLNIVILMGTIVDDPSMKYIPSGLAVTNFRLETPSFVTTRPPDRQDIVIFGKEAGKDGLAGWAAQYLRKGSHVIIQGRLGGKEFTTPENKTYLNMQVVAFSIESIDKAESE